MFSFLHEIPIQAFYTSALSLSCEITLFLITEQNKADTRFLLESARAVSIEVDIVVMVFVRNRFL
jgi:hypothetical protein